MLNRRSLVRRLVPVVMASWSLVMGVGSASGHAPGAILYGAGEAIVDGSLAVDEWNGAGRIDFLARAPGHDGGGTVSATLRGMNNGSTLYLSLEVARPTYGGNTTLAMYFDNNHDAIRQAGDDAFLADVDRGGNARFIDWHWGPCTPGGQGVACPVLDLDRGGTSEGNSAAGIAAGHVVIEVSHPLDSADDTHDFSLHPGDVVGFGTNIRLWSDDPNCNEGPSCYADTVVPIGLPSHGDTAGYGNVVVSPDVLPPETALSDGPPEGSMTASPNASFGLSGTDNLTPSEQLRFACGIDDAPMGDCSTRPTFSALSEGFHRLRARATDGLGNADPSPAERGWTVDLTAPTRPRIRISVRGRLASARLSSTDRTSGIAGFLCKLDRRLYRGCRGTSRWRVGPGRHVFRAIAVDKVGHRSAARVARFRVRRG